MKKNTHRTQTNAHMDAMASAAKLVGAPDTDRVLTPEEEQVLKAAEAELARLDRNTTAQTFERGALFAQAKAILPKSFSKWLKAHTTYSVRHAWNHINVLEKLEWHRKRCEAASVPPTTLFILATAGERVVEDVLSAFERGEKLTGARVKNMIAIDSGDIAYETVPMNVGGLKGAVKVAELRAKTEAARFDELARSILAEVEAAAEMIANGRGVTKKAMVERIEVDARHAHDLLKAIIAPVKENTVYRPGNWTLGMLAPDSAWGAAQAVFQQLGGSSSWAKGAEFPRWLTATVLPVLRFVVHGDELPGFEARRVVERQGAQASASTPGAEEVASGIQTGLEQEPHSADERVVAIETERRKRRRM